MPRTHTHSQRIPGVALLVAALLPSCGVFTPEISSAPASHGILVTESNAKARDVLYLGESEAAAHVNVGAGSAEAHHESLSGSVQTFAYFKGQGLGWETAFIRDNGQPLRYAFDMLDTASDENIRVYFEFVQPVDEGQEWYAEIHGPGVEFWANVTLAVEAATAPAYRPMAAGETSSCDIDTDGALIGGLHACFSQTVRDLREGGAVALVGGANHVAGEILAKVSELFSAERGKPLVFRGAETFEVDTELDRLVNEGIELVDEADVYIGRGQPDEPPTIVRVKNYTQPIALGLGGKLPQAVEDAKQILQQTGKELTWFDPDNVVYADGQRYTDKAAAGGDDAEEPTDGETGDGWVSCMYKTPYDADSKMLEAYCQELDVRETGPEAASMLEDGCKSGGHRFSNGPCPSGAAQSCIGAVSDDATPITMNLRWYPAYCSTYPNRLVEQTCREHGGTYQGEAGACLSSAN